MEAAIFLRLCMVAKPAIKTIFDTTVIIVSATARPTR